MTAYGFLSVPGRRPWRPCRAFPTFFGPFSVPPVVTAFTLQKALRLRNVLFFDFCSAGLGLRVLAFAVWVCFPPGGNGGFHLWRPLGESLGRGHAFFDRLILPDSGALGAGIPGLPGSWSLELLPPSRSGCMQLPLPLLFATPFAILRGCRRCLRLLILSGQSPLGLSPARYRSLAPSPSSQVARWRGGSRSWLPFSFEVGVTPRILKKELEWDFSSDCSPFSLRGCPASALAVAGIGGRVLRTCLFLGSVTLFPSKTLLFPSYTPRYRLRRSGCACLGLWPCGKCLRLCLQNRIRIALGPVPGFPVVSS